jgi:predicted nuclease of predicted toxin-antitoxin system
VKILLDECVDSRLAGHFLDVEVQTVHDRGWSGITNGKLLALAQAEFDVFVTVDRNLAFQQDIPKFSLAVILVRSVSNRLADLVALVPDIQRVIPSAARGTVTNVGRQSPP